jgi:hypothetical protein
MFWIREEFMPEEKGKPLPPSPGPGRSTDFGERVDKIQKVDRSEPWPAPPSPPPSPPDEKKGGG